MTMDLHGVITALITPFEGDHVDEEALKRLVASQIEAGVHGLVACGTTGETPTLSGDEYARVVRLVVECAGGHVPVLAGTGTNCTRTTIERTRLAKDLGADAALVVAPYYNKPQQSGLVAHYEAVAREGGLPVVVYNVPGRTGVNITPETIHTLSRIPGVIAVKEASGSTDPVREIVRQAPEGFSVLSGDDGLALASFALGARGVVSVASNVAPRPMVALFEAWSAGRVAEAQCIDRSLAPLYKALFVEPNPVPCKAAAAMMGLCRDSVRLPLVAASDATRRVLREALAHAGLTPVGP